ncbi:MAG TPA: acyltransferase [Patescibacteria group bacterium]|nr:acyltransferase [Patescibacteria group bacterium]
MKAEFPALTGIRAIAAYMVFAHHYFGTSCTINIWCPWVYELHSGVSIFFVLSGFLIAYKYYGSSCLNLKWLKSYYLSRLARIYPLFFLVTLTTLIFLKSSPLEWFLSLSFIKGLFSEYKFIVIPQTWTLTVEMVFYLLAPFIFVLAKRRVFLALQFFLIFLIGILITTGGRIDNLQNFISSHLFLLIYTFFGRCFEFLVGIFLALMILRKPITLPGKSVTYLGLLGVVLVILLVSNYQSPEYRYGIFSPQGLLIYNLVLPVLIAFFFLGLIAEKTVISFFLSNPLMQILGKSSYAFYLIHDGIFADLMPQFFRLNMPVFFISLNILAIILYFVIERPANTSIRKLGSRIFFNLPRRRVNPI